MLESGAPNVNYWPEAADANSQIESAEIGGESVEGLLGILGITFLCSLLVAAVGYVMFRGSS